MDWFVLRTEYNQEDRAARGLESQGLKTFLPIARTEYRRKRDGLLMARRSPVFRMYLFAQINWHRRYSVLATRGVKSFVGYQDGMEKAPFVPDDVMEELMSRMEELFGDNVTSSRPLKDLQPGQMVEILCGPYRERSAIVHSVAGSRVRILLEAIGGMEVPVSLPKDILATV